MNFKLSFFSILITSVIFANLQTDTYPKITFERNKTILTPQGKSVIDKSMLEIINSKDSISFWSKHYIILRSCLCKSEIKNPILGLIRAQIIIDYVQKKYKIDRSNFLIIDDPSILIGDCKTSFVLMGTIRR